MAAASWTTINGPSGVRYHTVTVNSTDGSAILLIDPRSKVDYTIKYDTGAGGNADTVSVLVSTAAVPAAANMVTVNNSITADNDDSLDGPITAIQVDSDATDTHVMYLIETPNYWSTR